MRLREINNARFFTNQLNKESDLDFVVDKNFNEEQSHIDVVIRSKKLQRDLAIQNVAYRNGTFYKYGTSNIPEVKPLFVLGKEMSDTERRSSILGCIKGKENKYPKQLLTNTILLIEITIPAITPEQIKKLFPGGITTDFMGIYFVQLPITMPSINNKYEKEGYIYPLKEINFISLQQKT